MSSCAKIILILLTFPMLALGQSDRKLKLEKEKARLQDEITLANKILEETRENRESSLGNIQTVEQKLRLRQNLIRTLDRETELLEDEIAELEVEIDTLEAQVTRLKEDYALMIRQARKSSNKFSRLMFLFSSQSFNQAIRRLEYLKQFSEYRRRQVEEIKDRENTLNQKIASLSQQKIKKENLRTQMTRERETLLAEKEDYEQNINQLRQKESEIASELEDKKARAVRVDNEIQRIIAEEVRRAKERAKRRGIEAEAQKVGLIAGKDFSNRTTNRELEGMIAAKREELKAANKPVEEKSSSPSYDLTPEASKLAASFAANKSQLPWPVDRGIVILEFGPYRHPVAKSVELDNNGIDIATEKGSTARSAFKGEVTANGIIRVPGEGFAVIVNHGNYYTIYRYLSEVYVKSGDQVNPKQDLGLIRTDDEGETVLHFELWKENQPLNPQPWLARKG